MICPSTSNLLQLFSCCLWLGFSSAGLVSCQGIHAQEEKPVTDMQIVRLGQADGKVFNSIKADFVAKNPGYNLKYLKSVEEIEGLDDYRVLFVQEGQPKIKLSSGLTSKVTVGDILLLDPSISMTADSTLSLLEFTVPTPFPDNLPKIIRPDWDPNITDIPGGCATETNAYRRILLTWKQEVGQYLYHDLNAHRVRIMDSFSHYHPVEGGFDEFYLVQMALPDARIITSNQVSTITQPGTVTSTQAMEMLKSTPLEVGDLVYLPRGIMHRGIGGVLAQVITVPGFIPGSEIGVDHHLKAINNSLNLTKNEALPYNEEAANAPIIK